MLEERDKRQQKNISQYQMAAIWLILGSGVGFALGGPLMAAMGAGVGLVLGAAVDAQRRSKEQSRESK